MQRIIVDGYNVIHADERLKRWIRSDLQKARTGLIRRLEQYVGRKNLQITVVFDGRGGLTDVEVEIPGKLQVLYSRTGQTADELIIEIVQASSNPRQYIVATSDMADIGRSARALGAEVLESKAFLARIRTKPSRTGDDRKEESVEDVEYWLDQFTAERENRDNDDDGKN